LFHKTGLTPPLFFSFKCLYQARKVSGDILLHRSCHMYNISSIKKKESMAPTIIWIVDNIQGHYKTHNCEKIVKFEQKSNQSQSRWRQCQSRWRQFHYTYDNFCVAKIKFIMYDIQDYYIIYTNGICPVISEGWYFSQMLKRMSVILRQCQSRGR
jgi:hypothetical protein